MTHLLAALLSALLTALGLGGGGGSPGVEGLGLPAHSIGRPVVAWDQARYPDILANPELAPAPRVIATEAERDRLLASEPLGPDLSELAAVDLDENVLVLAGYFRCQEIGAVYTNGHVVWFDAVPLDSETVTLCAWSPYTVEIFEVPRSAFGAELTLAAPPWGDAEVSR